MYPFKVIADLRPALPWTIYALPFNTEDSSPMCEHRFAIKWDEDNDVRVHAAVLDVYFRLPEALWNIYAVGERKGSLTIWAPTFPINDQSAWAAASRGPAIQDEWPVSIKLIAETQRTGGRQILPMGYEDLVFPKFPTEHDQLNWLIKLFSLGPTEPRLPW